MLFNANLENEFGKLNPKSADHVEEMMKTLSADLALNYDRLRIFQERYFLRPVHAPEFLRKREKLRRAQIWPPSFVYNGPNGLESVVFACTARTLLMQFLADAFEQKLIESLDKGKYVLVLKRLDATAQRLVNKFNNKYEIESTSAIAGLSSKFHFFFDPIQPDDIVKFDEATDIKETGWLKRGTFLQSF